MALWREVLRVALVKGLGFMPCNDGIRDAMHAGVRLETLYELSMDCGLAPGGLQSYGFQWYGV